MNEIGDLLRRTREAQGLTLEEISDMTKISVRYLEAIESGDYSVIPAKVYAQGFIRNYANVLGLDGAELSARFGRTERSLYAGALDDLATARVGRMQRAQVERRATRMRVLVRILVALVAILAVAAAVYLAGRSVGWLPQLMPSA